MTVLFFLQTLDAHGNPVRVELQYDDQQLVAMCYRAAKSKSGRCRSGAVVAVRKKVKYEPKS